MCALEFSSKMLAFCGPQALWVHRMTAAAKSDEETSPFLNVIISKACTAWLKLFQPKRLITVLCTVKLPPCFGERVPLVWQPTQLVPFWSQMWIPLETLRTNFVLKDDNGPPLGPFPFGAWQRLPLYSKFSFECINAPMCVTPRSPAITFKKTPDLNFLKSDFECTNAPMCVGPKDYSGLSSLCDPGEKTGPTQWEIQIKLCYNSVSTRLIRWTNLCERTELRWTMAKDSPDFLWKGYQTHW